MAKNGGKYELDDYGFDSELDLDGDFDFDLSPPKDDRSPVTKAVAGVKQGIKDTALSGDFAKRFIKKAFPPGYGQAVDLGEKSLDNIKNLYHNTAKELRPAIKELKDTTRRLVPEAKKYLPKKMADKLEEWSKEESSTGMSAEQMRESGISMQLGEIFKLQAEESARASAESDAKADLRDAIAQTRHKDVFSQLDAIRNGIQRLTDYQDKINFSFQRKSLELQFRHYYVAADMLEEQKRSNAEMQNKLAEIVKNTGLPDYVKMREKERLGQYMKNKFLNSLGNHFDDARRNFFSSVFERLGKAAKDKVSDFSSNFSMGLSGVNSALDTREMMAEMGGGISPWEMGGSIAGSAMTNSLGERFGKWAGKKLNESKYGDKIRRTGQNLAYYANRDNLAKEGNAFAQGEYDYGNQADSKLGKFIQGVRGMPFGNILMDSLQDAMRMNKTDYGFNRENLKDNEGISKFTNQTRRSITEVIPGFLARIHQEIQMLRTGGDTADLLTYDFNTGRFISKKDASQKAFDTIFNKYDRDDLDKHTSDMIDKLDPNKTLSPEERKTLAKFMVLDNANHGRADPERLADVMSYKGAKGASKFADLFQSQFEIDHTGKMKQTEGNLKRRNEFALDYNSLGSRVSDPRTYIQNLILSGQDDILEAMGLLDAKGTFQEDVYYSYLLGERPMPDFKGQEGTQKKTKRSRGMGFGRTQRPADMGQGNRGQNAGRASQADLKNAGELVDLLKQILEATKLNNITKQSDEVSVSLKRIEDILNKLAESCKGGMGGGMGETPQAQAAKKAWYQMTVGDILDGVGSTVVSTAQWAKNAMTKTGSRMMGLYKTLSGAGKSAIDWLTTKKNEFSDIWIKGELQPRLLYWKLQAGKYFDEQTGKVITKFEDIKGNVIDEYGEVVLRAEDLKNLIVPQMKSRLEKGWNYLKELGGKAKELGLSTFKRATGIYGYAFDKAKILFKSAREKLFAGQDVFVKGEKEPRLLAIVMRAGGYTSKVSKKTILYGAQIDGPVLDMDGNEVLSMDDLKKGIHDKDGNEFQGILEKALSYLKKGKDYILDKAGKVWDWTKKMGTKAKDAVKGFVGPEGTLLAINGSNKKTVNILTKIYNLLNDRLPGKKAKVLGDEDGDGIRENSWQDHAKKMSDRLKEGGGKLKDKLGEKWDSGKAGLASLLAGLKGRFGGKKDGEEGEDDGMDLADAKAGMDMASDAWKATKKGAGKAWEWGKKGVKGAGKWIGKIPGVGKLGGLLTKIPGLSGLFGKTAAAGVAGEVGGAVAKSAAGSFIKGLLPKLALAGLAGTALGGTGGLLAGTAALLLGWPVTLGVAAIGAGWAGYKAYTAKKLETLSTYRFTQYGFNAEQSQYVQQVFGLEDTLLENIEYGVTGPKINDSKLKMEDLVKPFGVDPKDETQMSRWTKWFVKRFKPVFLTHVTALRNINQKVTLDKVDKGLSKEEKLQYLEGAHFKNGPYDESASPVPGIKYLSMGPWDVEKVYNNTLAKVKATDNDDQKKTTEKLAGKTLAEATGMVVGNKLGETQPNEKETKSKLEQLLGATDAMGGTTSGIAMSGSSSLNVVEGSTQALTPLNVIRFKAYGLVRLEANKVKSLSALEQVIYPNVKFSGDTATWTGDFEEIIKKVGVYFGVSTYQSTEGQAFAMWFNARFLPIYLAYLHMTSVVAGKIDPKQSTMKLTAGQKLDIANAIVSCTGSIDGANRPVWEIAYSPWAGYEVNQDKTSVDELMKAIKAESDTDILKEKVPTAQTKANKGESEKVAGMVDGKKKEDTWMDKINRATDWVKDKLNGAGNFAKDAYNQAVDATSRGMSWISDQASSAYDKAKGYATDAMEATARAVNTGIEAMGGLASQIPMPTANGTWNALKDTITAASKMAGVDPALMAAMAAIESGFNYTVKAGTSSATGLYQFIKSTWDTMVAKYGQKYGIPKGTPATDPRANALMGAEYIKENMAAIQPVLNRKPTQTDIYLAHFLGAGGARKFFKADPNAFGKDILPDAAKANPSIFWKDKGQAQPRTIGEIYKLFTDRLNKRANSLGIATASAELPTQPGTGDQKATTAPAAAGATASDTMAAPAPETKRSEAIKTDAAKAAVAANNGVAPPTTTPVANTPAGNGVTPVSYNPNPAQAASQTAQQTKTTQTDFNVNSGITDLMGKTYQVNVEQRDLLKAILNVLSSNAQAASSQPQAIKTSSTNEPPSSNENGAQNGITKVFKGLTSATPSAIRMLHEI